MKFVVMGLCASLFASFTANAESKNLKVSVCIGQYSSLCPAQTDVQLGCDATIEQVERDICKVHNPDGSQSMLPSNSFQTGFSKGNRCDYKTYTVVCNPADSNVKWTKLEGAKVNCDAIRGIVSSGSNIVAFFPNAPREAYVEAYRNCLVAVAEAKNNNNSVMISTEGEVVPEDGSFVRKKN